MRSSFSLSVVTLLGAGLLLSGCGGGGAARTESTAAAAASTSEKITEASQRLDSLSQTLVSFRGAGPTADLKGLYTTFETDSAAVNKALAEIAAGADSTEQNGRTQHEEWNKQTATITDPDLRASSAKRGGDLRMAIEALASSNTSFKSVSSAFTTQIGDIKKVLDLDLTVAGIENIKPSINKAVESVSGLKTATADVAEKSKAITDLLATK
jgi:hypothetical protein